MGGKNNLLDTALLHSLFKESCDFNEQAEARIKAVQTELNKLNDTLIGRGALAQQEGDLPLTRESVLGLIDDIGVLKEEIEAVQAFVDIRLADSVMLEKETSIKSNGRATVGGQAVELYLKK